MSSLHKTEEFPAKNGLSSTKAREICSQRIFEKIYIEMKSSGLMQNEIYKTQKLLPIEALSLYNFSIKDLEMLTIVRLFDNKTFSHSIDTCLTARKKIDRSLEGGFSFFDVIRAEEVSIEQFMRACLFHDIGKIIIPHFLLNSNYTDENWAQAFSHMPKWRMRWIIMKHKLAVPKKLLDDPESLMEFIIKKRIRAVKFVPISLLFSKKQIRDLNTDGFHDGMSFLKIIQAHEKESSKILEFMGYATEAKIAGAHHNYEKESKLKQNGKPNYIIKKSNLSADILHLADIQEAMKSNRPYLTQRPIFRTLAFMVDNAEKGLVDCRIVYIWIKDELEKIDKKYIESVMKCDENYSDYENLKDRKEELIIIRKFISVAKKILEKSPIPILK